MRAGTHRAVEGRGDRARDVDRGRRDGDRHLEPLLRVGHAFRRPRAPGCVDLLVARAAEDRRGHARDEVTDAVAHLGDGLPARAEVGQARQPHVARAAHPEIRWNAQAGQREVRLQPAGDGPPDLAPVGREPVVRRAQAVGDRQHAIRIVDVRVPTRGLGSRRRRPGGIDPGHDVRARSIVAGSRGAIASTVVVMLPVKKASTPALSSRNTVVQSRQPTGPYRRRYASASSPRTSASSTQNDTNSGRTCGWYGNVVASVVQGPPVPADRDHPGAVRDLGHAAEVAVDADEVDRSPGLGHPQRRIHPRLEVGRQLAEAIVAREPHLRTAARGCRGSPGPRWTARGWTTPVRSRACGHPGSRTGPRRSAAPATRS